MVSAIQTAAAVSKRVFLSLYRWFRLWACYFIQQKSTMMKSTILASLIASAAAFAPASQTRASTAMNAMSDMPGSIDFKTGEFVFDPLKLSETYEPFLPFFREAELK